MTDLDLYATLDVAPGAESRAVERAYWRLVHEHQRLAVASPEALDQLNRAYEILSTPSLRREYDESRLQEAGHDNSLQTAVAQGATRLRELWPLGGLMRFAKGRLAGTERHSSGYHRETETGPADLTAALSKLEGERRPREDEQPLPTSEQLRLSTASLVERWRRMSQVVGTEEPIQADR